MKNYVLIVMTFLGSLGIINAQEIKWMSMNEALEAQKKEPKKIFMDVYTNWCGPCKMLDKNTFHNADVAKYINENFYPVKFNAEGDEIINYKGNAFKNPGYKKGKSGRNSTHEFTLAAGVNAYPTMIFFDESGSMIFALPSYLKPKELEPFLKVVGTDKFKEIKTQKEFEDYQKNFKSTFNE